MHVRYASRPRVVRISLQAESSVLRSDGRELAEIAAEVGAEQQQLSGEAFPVRVAVGRARLGKPAARMFVQGLLERGGCAQVGRAALKTSPRACTATVAITLTTIDSAGSCRADFIRTRWSPGWRSVSMNSAQIRHPGQRQPMDGLDGIWNEEFGIWNHGLQAVPTRSAQALAGCVGNPACSHA